MNDKKTASLASANTKFAKRRWPDHLSASALHELRDLTMRYELSIAAGDLMVLDGHWYITHTGLIGLATRLKCISIDVSADPLLSNPAIHRWIFKATVYKSAECKGFVGYGDAEPDNVSLLVQGAELRVAETRAVNRAIRKAYGIGLCSVEELGSGPSRRSPESRPTVDEAHPPTNGNGRGKLRDRLAGVIRQYGLDPGQVRAYALTYCGNTDARSVSRDQWEAFFTHLSEWAAADADALRCKLNGFAEEVHA